MMAPGKYNRPLITDGHEASSTGHDGPNSSPQVATSAPNAMHFDRPPLSAGHQSPSPTFMKASFEYPSEPGQPTRLNYAVMEKERARHALMAMHEHLSRQFPEACPMDLTATPMQPESRPLPPTAGIGKSITPEPAPAAPPVAAVLKAPAEDDFVDDAVYKGFKKMRKKLGKKVLAGEMTVDEARAKMGRQFAQKAAEPTMEELTEQVWKGEITINAARAKLGLAPFGEPETAQKSAAPRELAVTAPPSPPSSPSTSARTLRSSSPLSPRPPPN